MEFKDFKEILLDEFPETGAAELERFEAMDALYRDWNSMINVVSRKDIDNLYSHHVLHSLAIASYLKRNSPGIYSSLREGGAKLLDLGTGGGFPGIPMAVLFPKTHFTLCDSIGKKITVASGVADSLGLENVGTVNCRAEALPDTYDHVVTRAVATMSDLYPWVKGKFRGSIFCLKGGDVAEESAVFMGRFHRQAGSVMAWKIGEWLRDEYFEGKYVLEIKK